jgi:hypothetical protein
MTELLATAGDHGNAYWDTELRTRQTLVWLARDAPDEAVSQADEGIARWSHEGFHRQHYNHVLAHVQAALYRGDAEAGWERIEANWRAIVRSQLLRVQWTRIEASYGRARCAVLMASREGHERRFLSVARDESRRIRRERMSWSDPIADVIDAAIERLRGDDALARQLLSRAVAAFDRKGMALYAAAARRRLGALLDGDEGAHCRQQSDAWMACEGVVDPQRMTRLIAPGFVDA